MSSNIHEGWKLISTDKDKLALEKYKTFNKKNRTGLEEN